MPKHQNDLSNAPVELPYDFTAAITDVLTPTHIDPPHTPPYAAPDGDSLPYPENPNVLNSPFVTGELQSTAKHWTQSKTMWFNITVAVFGAIGSVLPSTQPYMNPQTYSILTTVIGLGNMMLRSFTKDAIR